MAVRKTVFAVGSGKGQINMASQMKVALTGLTDILQGLKGGSIEILKEAGQMVLDETIPLTPKDTGDLRESAAIKAERTSNGAKVTVSFGNETVDYAVLVHEDMEDKHWQEPGTGPKYLEKGTNVALPKIVAMFEKEYRKRARG